MPMFCTNDLLKEAETRTGLSDFGQGNFKEALTYLIKGINHSTSFRQDRAEKLREEILSLLLNRLWSAKDIKENPEIQAQALLPPVCICSLPRTGTTKLHRILGVSGNYQVLPYWKVRNPARIPGYEDEGRARRYQEADAFCEWESTASPEFKKSYTRKANEPEEELIIMDQTFIDANLTLVHGAPEYLEWAAKAGFAESYDYLLLQLKYLQWQFFRDNSKPYILKTPGHLGNEDQLKRIFPQGIYFVFSHRDPKAILASLCHLTASSKQLYYNELMSNEDLGQLLLHWFSTALVNHMTWRDQHPECPVLDLSFTEINDDSVSTVEKICHFTGAPFTEFTAQQVQQWDTANPRHKYGKPEFTLETYGLTAQQVDEAFAPYMDRYAIFF